jgi:hypothetical protein
MNTLFIIIYGFCFVFAYLIPMTLFLRRLRITSEFKELKNMVSEPKYDKEKNVVSIKTNFDIFSKNLEKSIRSTYPFKILQRICTDVNNGKRYSPSLYLSLYKNYQNRFLGNIFLASHIAPVIILVVANYSLDSLFDVLLSLQFIWYILVIAGQRLLSRNFNIFSEIYYSIWYDKLLNYDMLSINALKDKVFNKTHFVTPAEINKMFMEMQNVFKEHIKILLLSSEKLSTILETFAGELKKGDVVTAETIIVSLEENVKRFDYLCGQLENAALLSKESYKGLSKFIDVHKIDVNVINTLANEFSNLRCTLAGYTNTAEIASIEKLASITSTLENSINKTFVSIEETVKANADDLSKSYDRFFEICKLLVEKQEKETV